MNTAGIICEYNPFHSGHMRQIAETRRILGADCGIICIMSGNFVQRGECAVFPKHVRAAAAIKCGADLVIELPLPYVLSSAEGFALGGVKLIESLGVCTHLSFGSESGNLNALETTAKALLSPETELIIRQELKNGISFPAARQAAVKSSIGGISDVLLNPNDNLAAEYIKAIYTLSSSLEPLPVLRKDSRHDSASGVSGSAIRSLLENGGDISPYVPESAMAEYAEALRSGTGPVFPKELDTALLSRLRIMTADDFSKLPDVSEGLYMRIFRCAMTEPTVEEVIRKAKTRRYTMSRLRRIIMCACLGVQAGMAENPIPYIRLLAAGARGRELLREIKKTARIPIITKPSGAVLSETGGRIFSLEAAATDLYALGFKNAKMRRGGSEWTTSPYVEK